MSLQNALPHSAPAPSELQRLLNAASRRLRLLLLLRLASLALCITASAALVAVGLGRLHWFPQVEPWSVGALMGAGLLAVVALTWLRPLTHRDVARSIERRADLKERLSSAVEFQEAKSEARSPFYAAQQADADRCAAKVEIKALYPVRLPRELFVGLAAALALALLFAFPAPPALPSPREKEETAQVQKQGEAIQKLARDAQNAADQNHLDETKKAALEAQKLAEAMRNGQLTKKQALVEMQKLTRQVQEAQKRLAEQSAPKTLAEAGNAFGHSLDRMQREIAEAQKRSEAEGKKQAQPQKAQTGDAKKNAASGKKANPSEAMKQALQDLAKMQQGMQAQDNRQMQQALEDLAKRMQSGLLSPEEMQTLQQSLQDLAKSLAHTDQDQAAKMLQQLPQNTPRNGKPMDARSLQEMARQMNEIAKQMGKNGGETQRDRQALQELGKALRQRRLELGMGKTPSEGTGQSPSQPSGQGNQSGPQGSPSSSPGGSGAGNAAIKPTQGPSQASRTGAAKPNTRVTGQKARESAENALPMTGDPGKAASRAPYYQTFPSSRRAAESALSKENIPAAYKQQVRDYFDSIQPDSQK